MKHQMGCDCTVAANSYYCGRFGVSKTWQHCENQNPPPLSIINFHTTGWICFNNTVRRFSLMISFSLKETQSENPLDTFSSIVTSCQSHILISHFQIKMSKYEQEQNVMVNSSVRQIIPHPTIKIISVYPPLFR